MLIDQLVFLNAWGPAKMRKIRQWFAMMNIENLSGHCETYSVKGIYKLVSNHSQW